DVCLVRDPDGTIAGMTDVLRHPYEPEFVRQNFTGVDPRARGRGLGKWLKASMLLHVRSAYPEVRTVTTENAGSNAAMLAINHALALELPGEVPSFRVPRARLARACGALSGGQRELAPGLAPPVEGRRYHAFRRRRNAEWRPDEPLTPDAVAQMRMLAPDS